jgi:hypothetical protein
MNDKRILIGAVCAVGIAVGWLMISKPSKLWEDAESSGDKLAGRATSSGRQLSGQPEEDGEKSGSLYDSTASRKSGRTAPWLKVSIESGVRSIIANGLLDAGRIPDVVQRQKFLDELAAGLETLSDVYSAMAVCEELEATADRRYLMLGILSRWVALRPQEAAAWAESQQVDAAGMSSRRLDALQRVAVEWAKLDPRGALGWAETLAGHDTTHPLSDVYDTWAATAPADMAQWLSEPFREGGREMPAEAVSRLAKNWSASDPAAAAAWATGLRDGSEAKESAVRVTMLAWAGVDAAAAQAFTASNLPADSAEGRSARAILAAALVREDPAAALFVADELDGLLRRARMLEAFKALAVSSPEDAQGYYHQLADDDPLRASFAPYLAGGMAGEDLQAAMQMLAWTGPADSLAADRIWKIAHDEQGMHKYEDGFRLMLETWSARDPVAALTWMADHTEYVVGRETVLNAAVGAWAAKEPELAGQWSMLLPDEYRLDAVKAVAQIWASKDAAAALSFVERVENATERAAGLQAIARHIVEQQPVVAAGLYQAGQLQLDAATVGDLARIWGSQEPLAAARWLDQLASGASRDAAIRNLAESWFLLSPSQAEGWAARLSHKIDRDAASETIVRLRAQLK